MTGQLLLPERSEQTEVGLKYKPPGFDGYFAAALFDLTRSNVSNHLTCLRDCGIVVAEPEGRKTRYEIADPHLAAALDALVNAIGK